MVFLRDSNMSVGTMARAEGARVLGPTGHGEALGSYLNKEQKLWKTKQSDRICLLCYQVSVTLRIEQGAGGGAHGEMWSGAF